jgi:hypothetical protein
MKLPGFPQRVLPNSSDQNSSASSSPAVVKKDMVPQLQEGNVVVEEELLKFEDVPAASEINRSANQQTVSQQDDIFSSYHKSRMTDFDMRYEFSETRKVLEEFFPPTCKSTLIGADTEKLSKSNEKDFNDLEYTLKRRSPMSNDQGIQLHPKKYKILCNLT